MSEGRHISIERWGRDHWSLLAYVESCHVDGSADNRLKMPVNVPSGAAQLNYERMRVNENTHPLYFCSDVLGWKKSYGTRLFKFFTKSGSTNERHRIPNHDDIDCLYDMESAGLIEVISAINAVVRLTEKGHAIAARLREHKARGKHFAQFTLARSDEPKAKTKKR